jgi:hypothetical protein
MAGLANLGQQAANDWRFPVGSLREKRPWANLPERSNAATFRS